LQVPATAQAIVAARIDRLEPDGKRVLQAASVVGKDVPLALLESIVDMPEGDVRRRLARLQAAEFLYETRLFPEVEYTFKHALTHEVTYGGLLGDRRRDWHARIVGAIERLHVDRLDEHTERLAHHAVRGESRDKALHYLQQAGAKDVARSAYVSAIGHLTAGLNVVATLPESTERARQELRLQTALGAALTATKGFGDPDRERAYTRALELCDQVGDAPERFPVLWGLCQSYIQQVRLPAAHALAEQLMDVAQRAQDPALLLEAHETLGETFFWTGDPARGLEHFDEGAGLHHPEQHQALALVYGIDSGLLCRGFAAWALAVLGYLAQALHRLHELLSVAHGHPYSLATALLMATWVHMVRRDGRAAQEQAEALVAVATAGEFSEWLACGVFQRGWALTEQGEREAGIAQMREGWAAVRAAGTANIYPYVGNNILDTQG